jgi:hypothetical protein
MHLLISAIIASIVAGTILFCGIQANMLISAEEFS